MNELVTIIREIEDADGNEIMKIFISNGTALLLKLLVAIIILYIGRLVVKGVSKYIDRVPSSKIDPGAKQFTKSFVRLGIHTIFFLFAMLVFGFKEQSIITMISAIGLGVGISLKEFLSNFAGGVVILFARPFTVGNYISMNGVAGNVVEIGVFSTKVNTFDSKEIIIPNNTVISKNIINYDANNVRRINLTIPIAYGIDPDIAIKELQEMAKTFDGLDHGKEPWVQVVSYADSSVNIMFLAWTTIEGTVNYYDVKGNFMQFVLNRFNEKGIEIPYNKLDVYMHGENN